MQNMNLGLLIAITLFLAACGAGTTTAQPCQTSGDCPVHFTCVAQLCEAGDSGTATPSGGGTTEDDDQTTTDGDGIVINQPDGDDTTSCVIGEINCVCKFEDNTCNAGLTCVNGWCQTMTTETECVQDSDCSTAFDDGNPCTQGRCVSGVCENAQKCADLCNSTTGECTNRSCSYDNDCSTNNTCLRGQCVSGACTTTAVLGCCNTASDCPQDGYCRTATCASNVCGFENRAACVFGCDEANDRCFECSVNADCATDSNNCTDAVCDVDHRCVQLAKQCANGCDSVTGACNACDADSDCGAPNDNCMKAVCTNHSCREVLKCAGQLCNTSNGACYDRNCSNDSTCDDSNTCTTDSCDAGLCETLPIANCCNTASECPAGNLCQERTCSNHVCSLQAKTCAANLECNPATGMCDDCRQGHPEDCSDNNACTTDRCAQNANGAWMCENALRTDCPNGCNSSTGQCVACDADADCQHQDRCMIGDCSSSHECSYTARTCSSGQYCNSSTGSCTNYECTVDSDCGVGQNCSAHQCANNVPAGSVACTFTCTDSALSGNTSVNVWFAGTSAERSDGRRVACDGRTQLVLTEAVGQECWLFIDNNGVRQYTQNNVAFILNAVTGSTYHDGDKVSVSCSSGAVTKVPYPGGGQGKTIIEVNNKPCL